MAGAGQKAADALRTCQKVDPGGIAAVDYCFGGVVHGFTNPEADKMGRPEIARQEAALLAVNARIV